MALPSERPRVCHETEEDSQRLPSGGMPDTDPHTAQLRPPDPARDPEAAVVHANVLTRLLGDDEGPTKLGRFTLLERIAEGGMGVVFAAYDPELDRKVAVKLLRRDKADASMRRRIVREAQAMAKLSHPNVAQIFEVGAHGGSVFIAMEFVRGETMRAWQKRDGRGWREILEMYVQAGRGLAAAHTAGLVHRDFKPDNAIVGSDGRVRVVDFGLAHADESTSTDAIGLQTVLPAPVDDALGTPLTRTGSMMGTPAYMAAEQFLGEATDHRTDQFCYCVSLWEALYGQRPFAGETRADLVANVTRGRIRAVADAKVPPWLRDVLVRGLASAPSERHASMAALLEALAADPSRRRRRMFAAAGAVAVVALGLGGYALDRDRRIAGCTAAATAGAAIWDEATKDSVRASLLGTQANFAASTWERVEPRLDAFVSEWASVREQSCIAAEVEGTRSEELASRTTECLADARDEVAALIETFATADVAVVRGAAVAAATLPAPAACTDDTALLRRLRPPVEPTLQRAVADLRRELRRADALGVTGRADAGLEIARRVVIEAQALDWAPLHAEALLAVGRHALRSSEPATSRAPLEAAFDLAMRASHDDVAVEAATALVQDAAAQTTFERGQWWAEIAESLATRHGDGDRVRIARIWSALARVDLGRGALADARTRMQSVLEIYGEAFGPSHPEVARATANLAEVDGKLGEYARAKAQVEQALAVLEPALGTGHPDLAEVLGSLARLHAQTSDFAEAKRLRLRQESITQQALGPDHPETADALLGLASIARQTGHPAEAEALLRRVLSIVERAHGAEHRSTAVALQNLSSAVADAGRLDEAVALHERALAILETLLGPEHSETAGALNGVAVLYYRMGKHAEAGELWARALAINERALGPDHPSVAKSAYNLAFTRMELGDDEAAMRLFTRALAINERALGPDNLDVGRNLLEIGQLHERTGARAEARTARERALPIFEKALGADHRWVAEQLARLARLAVDDGRPSDAIEPGERALRLFEANGDEAHNLPAARFTLARALWLSGGDRRRAIALATAARDGLPVGDQGWRNVDAWLAKHRR